MKKILFILLATMLLQSCTSVYYQAYRVETEGMACENDAVVYEDDNCSIIYNLWGENGNLGFCFVNKTENDIYIDLTRSFFVRNGIAYDYYEDKSYTSTKTSGYSSTFEIAKSYSAYISKSGYTHTPNLWTPTEIGAKNTYGITSGGVTTSTLASSVTVNPVERICVPAKSSKLVKGFVVSDYVYLECDNNKFNWPSKVSVAVEYNRDSTPLSFRNKLVYIVNGKDFSVDNNFWVSSVANYSRRAFKEFKVVKNCLNDVYEEKEIFLIYAPNMFYNEYSK